MLWKKETRREIDGVEVIAEMLVREGHSLGKRRRREERLTPLWARHCKGYHGDINKGLDLRTLKYYQNVKYGGGT